MVNNPEFAYSQETEKTQTAAKIIQVNRSEGQQHRRVVSYLIVPIILWAISFLSLAILRSMGRWDLSGFVALTTFLLVPSVMERSNDVLGLKMKWKESLFVFLVGTSLLFITYCLVLIATRVDVKIPGISPARLTSETVKWFVIFLFGVAFPEEFFFRGFVQGRMNLLFGRRFELLGTRFGWGLFVSSLLFMLIHLPQGMSAIRFLTFFPGLLFGFMRERYDSIFPSVIAHALSNTLVILIVE